MSDSAISAVVLAGQRGGPTPLSRAANVVTDVLVPVAGEPALQRVIGTLANTEGVRPRVLVGPSAEVLSHAPAIAALVERYDLAWQTPGSDPASSSIAGVSELQLPVLITTGDHALLTPPMVEEFCTLADAVDADFVVALVPWPVVRGAFPDTRRTVLAFADEPCCGANMFLLKRRQGVAALEFWRGMQAHRKRPHRLAGQLGVGLLARYLLRRLPLRSALDALSERSGCRLGAVKLTHAAAAVDVDSIADWQLAERVLAGEAGA